MTTAAEAVESRKTCPGNGAAAGVSPKQKARRCRRIAALAWPSRQPSIGDCQGVSGRLAMAPDGHALTKTAVPVNV
jgi:hypothetical protein